MSEVPSRVRPAVCGGARLRYARAPGGGTRLASQWVRPPLHMTKVYPDRGWAISLLMSPTAGLLAEDVLELECTVEKGARVALINPAACRVHTMASGYAVIRQTYTVASDAVLDVWPAPLVLQKNATLRQETRLEVAPSATVLLTEIVSPGRASFGERFTFDAWSSRLRIYRAGRLCAFENFAVRPAEGDVADWRASFPDGPYASVYFLTPEPLETLVERLHELEAPDALLGASPLREGGLGVKILASDGVALRKIIFSVRNLLIAHAKVEFPIALKRAQTFFH